jgi:hypothetical protein
LRATLPTEVRVTRETHPLFGRLLKATTFRRWQGVVHLVVSLPDGSAGTIAADATDVFGVEAEAPGTTILSADGLRHLRALLEALRATAASREQPRQRA